MLVGGGTAVDVGATIAVGGGGVKTLVAGNSVRDAAGAMIVCVGMNVSGCCATVDGWVEQAVSSKANMMGPATMWPRVNRVSSVECNMASSPGWSLRLYHNSRKSVKFSRLMQVKKWIR